MAVEERMDRAGVPAGIMHEHHRLWRAIQWRKEPPGIVEAKQGLSADIAIYCAPDIDIFSMTSPVHLPPEVAISGAAIAGELIHHASRPPVQAIDAAPLTHTSPLTLPCPTFAAVADRGVPPVTWAAA
jgi:hypothetical protein